MSNVTTNNAPSGTKSQPKPATLLAGTNLLLVLIYGLIFVLMIVIFVKRAILRVTFLSQQKATPGNGSSKKTKAIINQRLDEAIHFAYEPQLVPEDSQIDDAPNFIYRMQAVDAFNHIDKALAEANDELQRPLGKSIRQHLLDAKSHSSGCLKSIRTNQLHLFSDMYTHARSSPETFGEAEYRRYMDLSTDIINTLRHRTNRKKLKERRLLRQNAASVSETNQSASTSYETTQLIEMPTVSLKDTNSTPHVPSPVSIEGEKSDSHPLLNETRT
uniref:Uncharacterized protein C1orf43 homolog n=1 Tax=Phallusia mammillata TaxID=59560 RepID=A0A6F9D8K3_9ASCI|nr:uncharacterized protein C1orf43 homolog [Phallusia mammillata]